MSKWNFFGVLILKLNLLGQANQPSSFAYFIYLFIFIQGVGVGDLIYEGRIGYIALLPFLRRVCLLNK